MSAKEDGTSYLRSSLPLVLSLSPFCGGEVWVCLQGALWPVTPRPAWMVGSEGGRDQRAVPLPPPPPHNLFEAIGYIVCESDRRPVASLRWDQTRCLTVLPLLCLYWSLIVGDWVRERGCGGGGTCCSVSYEHLGESVRPGTGDVAFRRMERHVVDRFLEFLSVSRELLDAGFTLQVPQTDGAVVTWGQNMQEVA